MPPKSHWNSRVLITKNWGIILSTDWCVPTPPATNGYPSIVKTSQRGSWVPMVHQRLGSTVELPASAGHYLQWFATNRCTSIRHHLFTIHPSAADETSSAHVKDEENIPWHTMVCSISPLGMFFWVVCYPQAFEPRSICHQVNQLGLSINGGMP